MLLRKAECLSKHQVQPNIGHKKRPNEAILSDTKTGNDESLTSGGRTEVARLTWTQPRAAGPKSERLVSLSRHNLLSVR